jgi:DNA polymerase I-like protein with 3'-5' exonuclease and polymerase domains
MIKLDDIKNYYLLESLDDVNFAINLINSVDVVAFDTETTGLNVRKDKIIGYSFSTTVGNGYYFPMFIFNGELKKSELFKYYPRILKALAGKKLVMHNASFDVKIVYNYTGVNLVNDLHADTVLMQHTLQEEGPFALKDIAVEKSALLGLDGQDMANQEQLDLEMNVKSKGGEWKKTNKEMYKADLNVLAKYACADTDLTLRLYLHLEQELQKQGLHKFFYVDEVMPLCKLCTIPMEQNGITMDMPKLIKNNEEIAVDIEKSEQFVIEKILNSKHGSNLINLLCEQYEVNNKGSFAQMLAALAGLDLPLSKSGKYSITKSNLEHLPDSVEKNFLLGIGELPEDTIKKVKMNLLSKDEPKLINISSKQQLSKLAFDVIGLEPLSKTEKGSPQFNEDFLETIKEDWAKELRVYNKLCKVKSSYYDRFLEEQEDGVFYPTFKQFATTSGRYGSDIQQLPRPLEDGADDVRIVRYVNTLRELFIAPTGYVFIDDDYESLEPRVFADDAADKALIDIFELGEDFYSKMAIQAEGIKGVSAHKKDKDFLKNVMPDVRQRAKAYSLGIRYGMKSGKLSMTLNISKEEAEEIIDGYFKAFPNLKSKMDHYLYQAKTKGIVISKYGRVRHLPRVKAIYDRYKDDLLDYSKMMNISRKQYKPIDELKDLKREYNNLLNNALNFPIQSAAASLVNRAMIAMTKRFISEGLDAWVCAQLHDQIVVCCSEKEHENIKIIVQDCMENTNKLAMKLVAKPDVARNFRDGH